MHIQQIQTHFNFFYEFSTISIEHLHWQLVIFCVIVQFLHSTIVTRSSAITEGPCKALCQLKSCQHLHNCTRNRILKACNRCTTWKFTQGHCKWCDMIGHTSLAISGLYWQRLYLAPFPRLPRLQGTWWLPVTLWSPSFSIWQLKLQVT